MEVRAGFAFDDSRWPITIIKRPHVVDAAGVRAFLGCWEACLRGGEPCWITMDFSDGTELAKPLRREIIHWMDDNEQAIASMCGGIALVLPTVLQRMICQSMLFVKPLPCPYAVHKTVDSALRWCVHEHDKRNVVATA